MLITANSPIKETDIKKLMTWGITEVETAGVLVKRIEPGKGSDTGKDQQQIRKRRRTPITRRRS